MHGETDLNRLISGMTPELDAESYVFVTTASPARSLRDDARMVFEEEEGVTLILPVKRAKAEELDVHFLCRRITLKVHSALEAVGFLAAVASELSDHGISTNAVAGFYHDHLFVPADKAEAALQVLRAMTAEARG